jgi:hypothetical protein
MEDESTQQFNDRLAQWVARQGFWFQLRYSMAGGGAAILMFHALKLLSRLSIFIFIAALVVLYLLVKRTDSNLFKTEFKEQLIEAFDCQSGKMQSFDRNQNRATIRYLSLNGGPKSFIEYCEATGVAFRMGLLDGIVGKWDASLITVDRMSVHVKAGAESPEEAADLQQSLSKRYSSLDFQALESLNTMISWGYSLRTMGSISQSRMTVLREEQGWRMRFRGGQFQQNWLKNLQINELVLQCTESAILVEKGEFTVLNLEKDINQTEMDGKVTFEEVKITGGLRPTYSGTVIFDRVPLHAVLQDSYHNYLEGTISGRFRIQGSTNSTDGIVINGRITLNDGDEIVLRNKLPILDSLSILNPSGTFRKTSFTKGSFNIKTTGGTLQVTEMNLTAPEQMELQGGFLVRPANNQEINDMLRRGSINDEVAQEITSSTGEAININDEITLRRAVELASRLGTQAGFDASIADKGVPFQMEALAAESQIRVRERLAQTAIFEGRVALFLPAAPFEKASSLKKMARNVTDTTIILDSPLLGNIQELTFAQAENLLLLEKATPKVEPEKP